MWYFIHVPKCAGRFVKKQFGIVIGHTHNNLKLKLKGMAVWRDQENRRTHQSSLAYLNEASRPQQLESIPDSFDLIHKGHFGTRKIAGTGFVLESGEGIKPVPCPVNVGLHQPLAERYVSEINPENGDGEDGRASSKGPGRVKITPEKSFTTIRNPISWLASYYAHTDLDGQLGWEWVNQIHGFKSFKEFVVGYCTRESRDWHEPCLQRFMGFQLFDKDDNIIPKYIIYKERLYEGIEKYLGHKVTAQIDRKKYPTYDYREMYDNEMIDLVNEKMKHELKLFNYDFEGPKNDDVGFVDLKHKYNIIKNEHYYEN